MTSRDLEHRVRYGSAAFHPRAPVPRLAEYCRPADSSGRGPVERGAVTLGFYGMWDGRYSNDRRLVVMHLGLAVTNDGLHYREPVPDFPIVSATEDGWEVLPDTRTSDN